jgi:hypothetical protein
MPTSSDLVTDLPADFEVFGQAVDTSLADLKGGTTGQILAKNSNTDMDFVWTTPFDSELSINSQTGTTYTFVLADGNDKLVTASNASAQTYSIPTNANVAFPVGLSNGGTAAAPKLRVQYSAASCIKVATDTWYVVGDLS